MGVLSGLEPKEVFYYFEEISRIPRASYHEERISDYCVAFAKEHGITVYQDALKNIIMIKEATPGYEAAEPLMLQGHLDMVCEKEPDCDIDFDRDGLRLKIEGDYITAEGTTLGGDDGIAVAYALAILASDTIEHPRLEVLLTVAEEVGMEGASGLDVSMLKGKKLLNLDSEEEGYMLTSCAGGAGADCTLPAEWEEKTGAVLEITADGLLGGHSGMEIGKGRANANLLLARCLMELNRGCSYQIALIGGGRKDNAIPREAGMTLVTEPEYLQAALESLRKTADEIASEYAASDPDIRITFEDKGIETRRVLTRETTRKAVILMNYLPNGIQRMSADIEGLVETSLNLGILQLTEEKLSLRYSVRSSVGTAKKHLMERLRTLTEYVGGAVEFTGDYPAWEYRADSVLREDMVKVYRRMYGKEPVIQAVHAGLECGILSGKIKDLDCVSIGPDMLSVHTTEEKLSISSTKRVWEYILEVIKCK